MDCFLCSEKSRSPESSNRMAPVSGAAGGLSAAFEADLKILRTREGRGGGGEQAANHPRRHAGRFLRYGFRPRVDDRVDIGADLPDPLFKRRRRDYPDVLFEHLLLLPSLRFHSFPRVASSAAPPAPA